MTSIVAPGDRIGFLGPSGTFTEEALRSDASLVVGDLVALPSFVDVLTAVAGGAVEHGFVAIENSIEGTVNITVDQLVFDRELMITHEVVLPVTQNLLVTPGAELADIRRVVSFPHATGQCRGWLAEHLPGVEEVAATSTAEAVRLVGAEHERATAAIGPALAASIYGLEVAARGIEDHADNATRFVLVSPPTTGVPAPSGHDKTSVVCFQSSDHPGSLHGILGQFSARDINLVKLESRPTKNALGDYCFLIDFEGHVGDEVVADCLRELHATQARVKFLGSYPAAGEHGPAIRRDVSQRWKAAQDWITGIQSLVRQ